ncbi:MAG: teichoic acid D-Ala incorporation-associated protein DltX [Streptococcaceae bacterium]|nr:teichoic acid D-Ala incorporation-associated protein DltX [Streptococcaceae bacterium]
MKKIWQKPSVQFIAKTLFYTVILVLLVYIYSYSQTGGAHFIYNEF